MSRESPDDAIGESFHFCRFYKGEAFIQAVSRALPTHRAHAFPAQLARHEHYLAHMMQLKAGMRVLDVGCGVGGPAREIARFSDATIVGLNNNDFQIQRANKKTARAGLSNQVSFAKGDFMQLAEQFGENSFDAGESSVALMFKLIVFTVYAIEATCHAPTFEGIYGEIFKVLKPGGIVSWVVHRLFRC